MKGVSVTLTTQWVLNWIAAATRVLQEKKTVLTELDSVIGDGDHGESLARGFAAVDEKLSNYIITTPNRALQTTGVILLAAVGGASGPLLGTAFLRAAKAVPKEAEELKSQDVAMILVKAAEGIAELGGAQPGGKTMLDAWYPAATNAAAAVAKGAGCAEILRVAADAAKKGAQSTLSMTAEKGRASLLGERSIGHLDPGAVSTSWILEAAAITALRIENPDVADNGDPADSVLLGSAPNVVQEVLKNLEMNIPTSGTAAENKPVEPSKSSAESSLATHEFSHVMASPPPPRETTYQQHKTEAAFSAENHSFQSAAMRLLADDGEAEATTDVDTGANIASALGLDLAAESDAESAYVN